MMLLCKTGGTTTLVNMDQIVGLTSRGDQTIMYGWGENCFVTVDEKFEDVLAQFNYSKVSE